MAISGSIETTKVEDFDSIMTTNVRGTFLLTQLAVPHLITAKGNIVNISSLVSLRSFNNLLAYSMSKSALDQFTRCISIELAEKGVRVNSINPGVIETNFHFSYLGEKNGAVYNAGMEQFAKIHPLGRVGQSEDCVNAIAYLANNKLASFVTGVTLPIDGGKLKIVEYKYKNDFKLNFPIGLNSKGPQ